MNETPEDNPPAFPFPRSERAWRRLRDGVWRVAVEEASMAPTLNAGDWLLLDPTASHWPRRGSIVVFREPATDVLAIKRVTARPGDRVRMEAGILHLAEDEAWLLGDNAAVSVDSRRYGPVPLSALVGRAWFRYGPIRRLGRLPRVGAAGAPIAAPETRFDAPRP
jgi:inner membrane protease subunit 2